jgi:hypothetical protein
MQQNRQPDDSGESSSQAVPKSGSKLPHSEGALQAQKLCGINVATLIRDSLNHGYSQTEDLGLSAI